MRTRATVAISGVIVLAIIGLFLSRKPIDRLKCQRNLRCIADSVQLYRELHTNRFPPDVLALDKDLLRKVLICPGFTGGSAAISNGKDRVDYIFVNWAGYDVRSENGFAKFPLAYDRRLRNHQGKGINVVLVDGSVLWDAGGRWLKCFAREHPFNRIAIPEE